jgi:hypothetical protein
MFSKIEFYLKKSKVKIKIYSSNTNGMNHTQLTEFKDYNVNRLIFSNPEVGNIPGSVSKLTFKRIRIATKNLDGTIGDLVLATPPDLMCYGLQEQTDPATGVVNGYQFPLVLWNRNSPTEEEKAFTSTIHKICDACKEHLVKSKDTIEKYDLEMTDLKKFNPLYYKMEKGKVVEGKGPMLYIKTMTSKKEGTIKVHTVFTDADTNEIISPMDLMGKRCYVRGAIKIESIFIGTKISLQLKLFEAQVKVLDRAFKSLLNPHITITRDEKPAELPSTTDATGSDTSAEGAVPPIQPEPTAGFTETGSLVDESSEESSDEEEEEEVKPKPPEPPKPAAKKTTTRKK